MVNRRFLFLESMLIISIVLSIVIFTSMFRPSNGIY